MCVSMGINSVAVEHSDILQLCVRERDGGFCQRQQGTLHAVLPSCGFDTVPPSNFKGRVSQSGVSKRGCSVISIIWP